MKEFTDSTNRTIILTLFFFLYIYIKYIKTQLLLRKQNVEIQCNPLEMVIGGLFDEETANKTFESCMKYNASNTILEKQTKQQNKFNENVDKLITDYKTTGTLTREEQEKNQRTMIDLIKKKADNVDNLVSMQGKINNTLNLSYTPFKNMVDKIKEISDEGKTIFKNINDKYKVRKND